MIIAIVELQKHKTDISIPSNIIYKFCYEPELFFIILLLMNRNRLINFYCAILFLALVVYLERKCNKKLSLNVIKNSIMKKKTSR